MPFFVSVHSTRGLQTEVQESRVWKDLNDTESSTKSLGCITVDLAIWPTGANMVDPWLGFRWCVCFSCCFGASTSFGHAQIMRNRTIFWRGTSIFWMRFGRHFILFGTFNTWTHTSLPHLQDRQFSESYQAKRCAPTDRSLCARSARSASYRRVCECMDAFERY